MRMWKKLTCTAAAALLLAACGAADDGGASTGAATGADAGPIKMTIGYSALGAAYADLYVCEDYGIFEKHGIDAELKFINSSSQTLSALASDSVQMAPGVAKAMASGILKGVDIKFISLNIPVYYFEMWGKSSIKSLDEIKGKKIGLSNPGSSGDASVDAMLKAKGWPADAVQKVFLGSTSAEVTALKKGAIDALVTQPPTGTQTRDFGFVKITDMTPYPAAANVYAVTSEYYEKNKEAVTRFLKADIECLSILHSDKEKTVASIQKHSGVDDKALAEYSYDFFEPVWQKIPTIEPALITEAFAQAAKEQKTDPPSDISKYLDDSIVRGLEKDGFVDSVYK
jgi:NitT/TauT family transport system substrate-binding protein